MTPSINVRKTRADKIKIPDSAIDDYFILKSTAAVASKYNCNQTTMWKFLKSKGVDTSLDRIAHSAKRKLYSIDDNYFNSIDTRDKAYILGLLSADGTMYKPRKQVRLKLTDFDLIQDVMKAMKYDRPIFKGKLEKDTHKQSYLLVICNIKIFDDLMRAGMMFDKSYNNKMPSLRDDLIPDFIRGFFDGNGSIYIGNGKCTPEVKIVSTMDLCISFKAYFDKYNLSTQLGHDKRTDGRIGEFRIRSMASVAKFYQIIYNDIEGQLLLARKYNKFNQIKYIQNDSILL